MKKQIICGFSLCSIIVIIIIIIIIRLHHTVPTTWQSNLYHLALLTFYISWVTFWLWRLNIDWVLDSGHDQNIKLTMLTNITNPGFCQTGWGVISPYGVCLPFSVFTSWSMISPYGACLSFSVFTTWPKLIRDISKKLHFIILASWYLFFTEFKKF